MKIVITVPASTYEDIAEQIAIAHKYGRLPYPHARFINCGAPGRAIDVGDFLLVTDPPSSGIPSDRVYGESDADYISRLLDLCARI